MNQVFDISRFVRLVRLDAAERGRNYLMMALLLLGLSAILLLPLLMVDGYLPILMLLHPLALFMVVMFGGSLYTANVFSHYGPTDTGIAAIMVPASQFEKFLNAVLIVVLFILPFTVLFVAFHYWSIDYVNSRVPAGSYQYNPVPPHIMRYFICLHLIIQGAVLLGSVYFSKLSYIKTASALFLTALLAFILNIGFAYFATGRPTKVVAFPFSGWDVWYFEKGRQYSLAFTDSVRPFVHAFPLIFCLAAAYIAFVRLKEKQI